MSDTHFVQPKITGYRQLSAEDAASLNELKALERALLAKMEELVNTGATPRWAAIAKTHFEQGFMAACRAVAKPNGE